MRLLYYCYLKLVFFYLTFKVFLARGRVGALKEEHARLKKLIEEKNQIKFKEGRG